jgi:hypothetical protein
LGSAEKRGEKAEMRKKRRGKNLLSMMTGKFVTNNRVMIET